MAQQHAVRVTTATARTLTMLLPLPPAELNPNARYTENDRGERVSLHWGKKAKRAAYYRELCGLLALAARKTWQAETGTVWEPAFWEPLQRATLDLAFTFCGSRRWDDDACIAAFKPSRDSLIDAGVIVNDSAKRLQIGRVTVEQHTHSKHPVGACPAGVLMTITEQLS